MTNLTLAISGYDQTAFSTAPVVISSLKTSVSIPTDLLTSNGGGNIQFRVLAAQQSSTSNIVTLQLPDSSLFTVSNAMAYASDSSIFVSWDAPIIDDDYLGVSIDIQSGPTGNGQLLHPNWSTTKLIRNQDAPLLSNSVIFSGDAISANTWYQLIIKSVYADGNRFYSIVTVATTLPEPIVSNGNEISVFAGWINVYTTSVSIDVSALSQYRLETSDGSVSFPLKNATIEPVNTGISRVTLGSSEYLDLIRWITNSTSVISSFYLVTTDTSPFLLTPYCLSFE